MLPLKTPNFTPSEESGLQPGPPPPAGLPPTHHDGGWSSVKTPRGGPGYAAASPGGLWARCGATWPPTGGRGGGWSPEASWAGSLRQWGVAGGGRGGCAWLGREVGLSQWAATSGPRRAPPHVALRVREGCHGACARYGAPGRPARPRPHRRVLYAQWCPEFCLKNFYLGYGHKMAPWIQKVWPAAWNEQNERVSGVAWPNPLPPSATCWRRVLRRDGRHRHSGQSLTASFFYFLLNKWVPELPGKTDAAVNTWDYFFPCGSLSCKGSISLVGFTEGLQREF